MGPGAWSMMPQTRTIAVVALCVLLLHIGAVWALQRGLWMRPHAQSPRPLMQVRMVLPAAPAATTQVAPDAGPMREPNPPKPAQHLRPHGALALDAAPAGPQVFIPPKPALARPSPGGRDAPTQVQPTPAAEPARMPTMTSVMPAPPPSSGSGPATDAAAVQRSATTDDVAAGPTSTADTTTASTTPSTRRTPAALQMPSTDAYYLQNPSPDYPPISRRLREQGTVFVDVLVTDQGLAKETRIQKTSGYFRLDKAAATTVATWRFVPGKKAGVAQSMWFTVPIDFQLE